jgi:6,7-dimethyl-8-ribityllumazine synthase
MKNKILIVTAMFYDEIGSDLFYYTSKAIEDLNTTKDGWVGADIYPVDVPGVFEIPVMISKHIHKMDGAIALGCVIKGETPHFEFISKASIDAIMKLSIEHKKPIGNGILTCLNQRQASVRCQTKGQEAANAVIKVLKHIM